MKVKDFSLSSRIRAWFDKSSPLFTTRMSLLVSILMASGGIFIGILEGSLAVHINGLVSAVDILNSAIMLTAVNQSVRQPDYIYNYGYGKYESISILAVAGLLLIVLIYAIYEAVFSLFHLNAEKGNYYVLLGFSLLSFASMRTMYRVQKKSARKFKMPILDYDASICKIDSMLELGVVLNLISGAVLHYFGFSGTALVIDAVTAVVILAIALKVPLKGSREALNQLLDKTLPDEVQFKIIAIVAENLHRICQFKTVHTRQSGKDIFVEIDVVLPYDLTLEEADALEKHIIAEINKTYSNAVARVYATPCDKNCRNCLHIKPALQQLLRGA